MDNEDSKIGLSIADIFSVVGFVVLAVLFCCGCLYSDKGLIGSLGLTLSGSIWLTLGMIVLSLASLIAAVLLKKTKPYNKKVWRCTEYGCVVAYIIIACFTFSPIGVFLGRGMLESKNISTALENDTLRVDALLAHFDIHNNENLTKTCEGMKLILGYHNKNNVDDRAKEFITDQCGIDDINELDMEHINSYKSREERAIRERREEIETNYKDSIHSYNKANLFVRPDIAKKIISQYNIVANFNQEFVAEPEHVHEYPSFDVRQRFAKIAPEDLDYELGKSEFKTAWEKVTWNHPLSLFMVLVIHLFCLLPYIVGKRQNLIVAGNTSGDDVGGIPLIV